MSLVSATFTLGFRCRFPVQFGHSPFISVRQARGLNYLTDRESASDDATYELCLARTENPGAGGSIPPPPLAPRWRRPPRRSRRSLSSRRGRSLGLVS